MIVKSSRANRVEALVFDAYGTLLDVESVAITAERLFPGHGSALSKLWRTKQLEYSWLQSLMMSPSQRREDFAAVGEGLASHGWSIALPGYSLAPEATVTQIVAEIHSALDWLAANGKAHGIAGPIILSGWSAGGHLTAMVLRHPAVKAGLAISGIYELGPIRDTYLNEKLKLTDEEIATLSPSATTSTL